MGTTACSHRPDSDASPVLFMSSSAVPHTPPAATTAQRAHAISPASSCTARDSLPSKRTRSPLVLWRT
eukprot:3048466-Prymnesium_polylepis.1